jgi:hypothetical protein
MSRPQRLIRYPVFGSILTRTLQTLVAALVELWEVPASAACAAEILSVRVVYRSGVDHAADLGRLETADPNSFVFYPAVWAYRSAERASDQICWLELSAG